MCAFRVLSLSPHAGPSLQVRNTEINTRRRVSWSSCLRNNRKTASQVGIYSMERNLCHYSSNKSSVLQINTICFAKKTRLSNKRKLICKYKLYLRENAEVWTNMLLCVTTVRLICLFMTKCDDFSQCVQADFLPCVQTDFSHKCVQADFLTCVQTDLFSQMQSKQQMALLVNLCNNTGLPFQGIQQTNMSGETGEFLSYYFYN